MKVVLITSVIVFWFLIFTMSTVVGYNMGGGLITATGSGSLYTDYWSFLFQLLTFQVSGIEILSTFLTIMNVFVIVFLLLLIRGN